MLPDDQIARMEYLAARSTMPHDELCGQLAERLGLPPFDVSDDGENYRAFSYLDHLEYNITCPKSGSLHDWFAYAPVDFTLGVNLTIGRRHPTILRREWDFTGVARPVGQALADLTGNEVLHYGSWISAQRTTRRDIRFSPSPNERGQPQE